ncbi:MAG: type IV pilus secretin PilQ [Desulfobacteraceae bacterium]|nr:type IV pilus secretin PilQ [Desulfobacteraceae bacterium]
MGILIRGKAKLAYTSIKQDFPFGVAIYLPETGIEPDVTLPASVADPVESVRAVYADQKQTTAKVEILLNQDIAYEVKEQGNDLQIVLFTDPAGKAHTAEQAVKETAPKAARKPSTKMSETTKTMTAKPGLSDTSAVMTGIAFDTTESGHAQIQVDTSHPVRYETTWQSPDQLDVTLYNTRIPEHHQRPLLTKYFKAAVERILPRPGPDNGTDAKIEIMIREKVPFRVVQNQGRISLLFDPATIEPPRFEKPVTMVSSGSGQSDLTASADAPSAMQPIMTPSVGQAASPGNVVTLADEWKSVLGQDQPRYTGEKIKLDFYDTDIKNVFRILRSVSGLNFAVDKDVQGKVTMTLEKPIPWDQVLDLVLKMNGLGKKMEGDVVRIATVQTLKQEDQDLQDAISARKKSLEQKKSLEPLVTEYIPINYSSAQTDIQPHIASLLTPDRGNISVDERTNMIIVTDTREKVDQIQKMIYRLDTVTPQIMIEAKVVEVTKDFSRSIGVGWNLSNDGAISSGFVNDTNVSVNNPTGSGISGDFSFFRLFGSSSMALNAKLEASEARGDVRIVSSPRILTLDNKKARIKQGLEVAFLERDDAGGSSVQFKDVDLLLEVTPHVTPDKRISLQVFLTKNDISGVSSTGVPTLATNETETELLVNDNDTVVIGGIVKTTTSQDVDGLPFLTGIPILGKMLFGTTEKKDNRNELLIFLTPSIVQLEQKRNISQSDN